MRHRIRSWSLLLAASLILCLPVVLVAQTDAAASQPMVKGMADAKFGPVQGLPKCAQGAVQSGDPTKGSFVLLAKMAPDCAIPWHWHTGAEQLMVVSGEAHVQTKEASKPETLSAGSFASMPAKHVHMFHAAKATTLFISSDVAFDIHYVDAQGKELTTDEALKGAATAHAGAATKPPSSGASKPQTGTGANPH